MNISELARQLDVSVTTVSRVLSGRAETYRISAATAARVKAAADEHGVVPDPLGSSLRRGRLGMVGLLVPDITNPFFSELARAIESRLRERGMAVLLSDSAESAETEDDLLGSLLARRLDGLLVAPVGSHPARLVEGKSEVPMPVVLIDRVAPGLDLPSVSLDNAGAGRLAAEHLIAAGHRRIACLRGDPSAHPDSERLRGVREAMEAADLVIDESLFFGLGYSREHGLEGARRLLSMPAPPSALITLAGQGVLGVLQAADEFGIEIPADLSIVAFDEQPWSSFVRPPLTTVVQPIEEMAEKSVECLLARIESGTTPPAPASAVFTARIEERDSVAAPPDA